MSILEVIKQAKADAIADGSYALPSPRQILLTAGLNSAYFHQRSDKARAAKQAYKAAQEALTIRKFTPLAAAKLAAYDRLETELRATQQQCKVLEQENDRLILELQLFRSFESEYLKMKREMNRFAQDQQQEGQKAA